MSGKTLVYMRTHYIDQSLIYEFSKLSSSVDAYDYMLFIDNHAGLIKEPSNHTVNITLNNKIAKSFLYDEKIHQEMKLPYYTDNVNNNDLGKIMWYCSDYPMYVMRKYFPEYDYYWQIEPDVFCNGNSYKPFFEKFKDNNADLIIQDYGNIKEIDPNWYWQYRTEWCTQYAKTYKSLFPVVRISARALDFLYKKRLDQAKIMEDNIENPNARWIFCEFFVATELTNNGFLCQNLDEPHIRYLPVYNLNKERIFERPDFRLYHPVK